MPKIGFICGSLRSDSINKQLRDALIAHYSAAGFETEVIDLTDYPLPIYCGDLDVPETLQPLIDHMLDCDGIVIVTPEYNGEIPALVKNTIDWITTVTTEPFRKAVFGIAACTPGPLSGIVCLRALALLLMRIGGRVCPTFIGVGNAANAFDKGQLAEGLPAQLTDKQVDEMKAALR